jgi:hypothetical protein
MNSEPAQRKPSVRIIKHLNQEHSQLSDADVLTFSVDSIIPPTAFPLLTEPKAIQPSTRRTPVSAVLPPLSPFKPSFLAQEVSLAVTFC